MSEVYKAIIAMAQIMSDKEGLKAVSAAMALSDAEAKERESYNQSIIDSNKNLAELAKKQADLESISVANQAIADKTSANLAAITEANNLQINVLKKKSDDLDSRENLVSADEQRIASNGAQLDKRSASLDTREQALDSREASIAERENKIKGIMGI